MELLHLIIEKAIFRVDHVKYCRRNRHEATVTNFLETPILKMGL